jgi:RNA polymerase sigma-70 factor (ECF subfamily)
MAGISGRIFPVCAPEVDGPALDAADEDVRLMLACRAGDDGAFGALFRRWSAPLLRYLERMLGDVSIAEDLVQEAFLRAYRARERYSPDARFSTWLYTIANHLALNELRRPRRRHDHRSLDQEDAERSPLQLADDPPRTEETLDAKRQGAAIESALSDLPERQRAALLLTAVEGMSYADAAESLDTSEQSVKALVHRARVALADRLHMGE